MIDDPKRVMYISRADHSPQPSSVLKVPYLPRDIQNGDVIFMSPSGELRGQPPRTRIQRLWLWIDAKVQKMLGMR